MKLVRYLIGEHTEGENNHSKFDKQCLYMHNNVNTEKLSNQNCYLKHIARIGEKE